MFGTDLLRALAQARSDGAAAATAMVRQSWTYPRRDQVDGGLRDIS